MIAGTSIVFAVLFLSAAFATSAASAAPCKVMICDMAPQPFWHIDKKVRISDDCAFANAGTEWGDDISANAAVDIGGGRIGQRWIRSGCGIRESVVIADCNTLDLVEVDGVCEVQTLGVNDISLSDRMTSADLLFPPAGNLRLHASTTVADVIEIARQNAYTARLNVLDSIGRMKKRNRVNPFCGCGVFYPDTLGAAQ